MLEVAHAARDFVTRFFEELAPRRLGQWLVGRTSFVAAKTGGKLDDCRADGPAVLFNKGGNGCLPWSLQSLQRR